MKTSQIAKRLFGGIIIFLGLVWFATFPISWHTLRLLKLGFVMYAGIGLGCLVTGALILRLTRQRLLPTSLGVALVWSLVAGASLVSLTHAHTYAAMVSEIPQDSVRVALSQTHWLLQRLRAGDTNGVIAALEGELHSGIVRLEMVPVVERKTNTIRVLERARAYRAAHPRSDGQASVEHYTNQMARVDSFALGIASTVIGGPDPPKPSPRTSVLSDLPHAGRLFAALRPPSKQQEVRLSELPHVGRLFRQHTEPTAKQP